MARKKILIVGGGTAGWLSAIVLHKKYDVHLVESLVLTKDFLMTLQYSGKTEKFQNILKSFYMAK